MGERWDSGAWDTWVARKGEIRKGALCHCGCVPCPVPHPTAPSPSTPTPTHRELAPEGGDHPVAHDRELGPCLPVLPRVVAVGHAPHGSPARLVPLTAVHVEQLAHHGLAHRHQGTGGGGEGGRGEGG